MTGLRFGRLLVIERGASGSHRTTRWRCKCDCGRETLTTAASLRDGRSQSCGCKRIEDNAERMKTQSRIHGLSETPIWLCWRNMRQRCQNANNSRYRRYGDRGIKVCERWESFENFHADMGDPPTSKHTIDRIDNNGDYTPENCRWATAVQQASNRSNNTMLTLNGVTQTMSEWSRQTGIGKPAICVRLYKLGWPVERALTEPVTPGRRKGS